MFFCIELPQNIRELLTSVQAKIDHPGLPIKWVEPYNLHITLLFLGELAPHYLPVMETAVLPRVSRIPPYMVSLDKLGFFPNSQKPKVIWVGIDEGRDDTIKLHDIIVEALATGAIRGKAEGHRFFPHITLGRIRESRQGSCNRGSIRLQTSIPKTSFKVDYVTLMRSDLTAKGPIYRPVFNAPLLSK